MLRTLLTRLPLLAAALVFPTGCTVLQPVKDDAVNHLLDAAVPEKRLTAATPAVAIGRPSLPGYLDRQQLVSRTGEGQAVMNPKHLWAEPLDAGIARATAENLSRLTGSLNIRPVADFTTMDYTVLVDLHIRKFEADPAGQVTLECTWKLQPVSGAGEATQFFQVTLPAPGTPGPAAQVAAMNDALGRLAREIAPALR